RVSPDQTGTARALRPADLLRRCPLSLAVDAVERRTLPEYRDPDPSLAVEAGQSRAPVDVQVLAEITGFPVPAVKVPQGRTACLDRTFEYGADGFREQQRARQGDAVGAPLRVYAREEQGFACIDVADADYHGGVH